MLNAYKTPHRGEIPLSIVSAMVVGAAEKYYKAKVEKYKAAAEIFRAEICPLIFEASGRMHRNSIKQIYLARLRALKCKL